MQKIIPEKIKTRDQVRVIAPSRSAAILSSENYDLAFERIKKEFGISVTFSKNHKEKDMFASSSVESRVSDIHDAFSDKSVKMISTVIGGFNSNQLLKHLDWDLIKSNPKILCGYSDITVLANAIYTKTGLVTYSGPHFSTFAQKQYLEYTIEYFKKCLMEDGEYTIQPSKEWLDDQWYRNQDNRTPTINEGYWVMKPGTAEGTIIGGNLSSFSLLFGTEYIPDLIDSIVFIEVDNYTQGVDLLEFERQLQSLLQQKGSEGIKGIIIGRFQKGSEVTREKLQYVIDTKKELQNIPVIANVDFGHTNPMITFPIGGICKIKLENDKDFEIKVMEH
jgi:muramoyltetrapeptide carboxypeptidase LdcA involved in peptidoglycan recycling